MRGLVEGYRGQPLGVLRHHRWSVNKRFEGADRWGVFASLYKREHGEDGAIGKSY